MNPIFGYKASEELHSDSWGQLCNACNNLNPLTVDTLKSAFQQWESEYKETTGLPLPSAWRSAKSVLKNAVDKGIPFVLPEGPRGKTAVEKDIKEGRAPLSEEEQVKKHLDAVLAVANPSNRDWISDALSDCYNKVNSIR